MGGKERCEAEVRQMVVDNEDVETWGGREGGRGMQAVLQPGSPQKHSAYWRGGWFEREVGAGEG